MSFRLCLYLILISFLRCAISSSNQTESDLLFDLNNTHSLESFIHWTGRDVPNIDIKTLKLALRIDLMANKSAADNQDFYHMATAHLKKLMPNLESIELHGAHCFYPFNGVDANQFKNEISFLSHSIESIWKAFRYVDVVIRLSYKIALVFNKESIESTNVEELLRKLFGQGSAIHSSSNKTSFILINDAHKNHLDIRLKIVTDLKAVQELTNLQHGRLNYSDAEREFYKVPESGFNEEVFISGKKLVYRAIFNPLYLEDFITKVNIQPQTELEKLTFNLLFYPLANKTIDELNANYERAVKNLKRAGPRLNHIDLRGGHSLLIQNGTQEDVKNELKLLKNGLNALIQAFNTHNLTLHSVIMQIFMVLPEEAFVNYTAHVFETFDSTPNTNITSFPDLIVIDQKLANNVEIRFELSTASNFSLVQSMTKLTDGYSEDFTAVSLFSNLNESYIRGEMHIHDW